MAKTSYLGVEIGNRRIKLAETKNERLIRFAVEDIPEDMVRGGEILQWEAMADLIRDCIRKYGFSCKKGAVVVPDSIAYTRRTRMPAMSAAQLEYNLAYEFHDFISDDKDQYIYDYSMVGLIRDEEQNVTEMDLLAIAVSKKVMDNYLSMFKRAGVKLLMAAPESRAIQNVFHCLYPELAVGDFAVLDLGCNATRVDIFSHGIYEVTRSIDTGGMVLANTVADVMGCDPHIAEINIKENREGALNNEAIQDLYGRIAIDVMRAINYYTFENRENTLETMYYCGGGAGIKPLIEEIRETIQLELVPLSELAGPDTTSGEALMNGAAAIGICWNQ